MKRSFNILFGGIVVAFSVNGCAAIWGSGPPVGKLPLPSATRDEPERSLASLKAEIERLNPIIGSYPPKFTSDEQKEEVYRDWSEAFIDAVAYREMAGSAERVLWTAAELGRQGHNMDVDTTAFFAAGAIEKCLQLFPRSELCHFSSVEYYSSVRPSEDSLKHLERSLVFLRKRLAPKVNETVEEKFISLLAYKGEKKEAVKQIDRFLKLFPNNKNRAAITAFRKELV